MPKFQEWSYTYADNPDENHNILPGHVRMNGRTMCGLMDGEVVEKEGPFRIRKTMHKERDICLDCEVEFRKWLSEKYPMLEGWT